MSTSTTVSIGEYFAGRHRIPRSARIHPSVRIHPTARIECADITIGAGGVIGENCVIKGTRVEIGRDFWMDAGAVIGGGSCHDPCAFLKAGDWLHMGRGSQVNTARGVTIGDECGIGIGTNIFTHGAYLDELAGFPCAFAPVVIGSRVWLPHAWVNPGVTIGSDVVVGAGAVINRDLPSGCLAGGVPCNVLKEGVFPRVLTEAEKGAVLDRIIEECRPMMDGTPVVREGLVVKIGSLVRFDIEARTIEGISFPASETVRNQLRRHGIRFRYSPEDMRYVSWASES